MGIDEVETNMFRQRSTKDSRAQVSAGVNYTLPMLVIARAEVYLDGNIRFQLMREDIPVAKRLRAGFMVNTDQEYMVDMMYILTRNLGLRTHYDSDMGLGFGVTFSY